jgi:hypothetical protein
LYPERKRGKTTPSPKLYHEYNINVIFPQSKASVFLAKFSDEAIEIYFGKTDAF